MMSFYLSDPGKAVFTPSGPAGAADPSPDLLLAAAADFLPSPPACDAVASIAVPSEVVPSFTIVEVGVAPGANAVFVSGVSFLKKINRNLLNNFRI